MSYSPLTLTALNSLLGGNGLQVAPNSIRDVMAQYGQMSIVRTVKQVQETLPAYSTANSELSAILTQIVQNLPIGYTDDHAGFSTVINGFVKDPSGNAKTNPLPTFDIGNNPQYIGPITVTSTYLSGIVALWVDVVSFYNKFSKFCVLFSMSKSSIEQLNETIGAMANIKKPAAVKLFTNHTFNMTAGVSALARSDGFKVVAADLANLGKLIDFSLIADYGDPASFIKVLTKSGRGLTPEVISALSKEGLSEREIIDIANTDTVAEVSWGNKAKIFKGLQNLTGSSLQLVKDLLLVNNPYITNGAHFFDLKKLFPNSWKSLEYKLQPLYTSSGALGPMASAINSGLLGIATNAQLAKANIAFRQQVMQIANVQDLTTKKLAELLGSIETAADTSLLSVGPAPATSAIESAVGSGSGPSGTYLMEDVVGLIANKPLRIYEAAIDLKTKADALLPTALSTINTPLGLVVQCIGNSTVVTEQPGIESEPPTYTVSLTVASNTFEATGTNLQELEQTVRDHALGIYAPPAMNALTAFNTANSAALAALSNAFIHARSLITEQISKESSTRKQYEDENRFYYAMVTTPRSAAMSFAKQLHAIGTDTATRSNEVLEALCAPGLAGDAIKAAMREGRNLKALQANNIPNTIIASSKVS